MNKFIKIASLILVLVLSMSVAVLAVYAEETPVSVDQQPVELNYETGELIVNDYGAIINDIINQNPGAIQQLLSLGINESVFTMDLISNYPYAVKIVKIQDEKITAIGEMAFLNSFRLEKVYIPETVTEISEGAFWGCPGDVKIYAPRGSAAEKFAKDNGFTYKEYSGEEKDTEGNMSDGISVTILGVGVVFLILIILCLVLKIFEIAFGPKKKAAAPAPVKNTPAPAPVAPSQDDTELVAVITAAIAASLGTTSTSSFRIKSLRRLNSGWNKVQNFNNNF